MINWFKKHRALSVVMGLLAIIVIASSSGDTPKQQASTETAADTSGANSQPIQKEEDTPKQPEKPSETPGQKNAVKKAKNYLSYSAFSRDGLVSQLEYEQFSHEDAVYGADHANADWNEQAAKKAKQYLDTSSFSHDGLVSQLEYEKFTPEQAEYGATKAGL